MTSPLIPEPDPDVPADDQAEPVDAEVDNPDLTGITGKAEA